MRRTMAETHGMRYGNLMILTFVMGCMFFFLSPAAAQEDVGMVTRLSGEAVYWGAADHGKSSSAQAFMKVRDGDFFKISDAQKVTEEAKGLPGWKWCRTGRSGSSPFYPQPAS